MKDVAKIEVLPEGIMCYDIIGEKRNIPGGKFKLLNLVEHSIIVDK